MIYGYGCVSSTYISRKDEEALKNTNAYSALNLVFTAKGLPKENIRIDLITANYRKRKHLEWLLENAGFEDCVVITSVMSLGTTSEEVRTNYLKLYKKNIAIRIEVPGNKKYESGLLSRITAYSTALSNYRLDKSMYYVKGKGISFPVVRNLEKLGQDKELLSAANHGRSFINRPENFETVYWLYENYFISEPDAYDNPLMKTGKKQFYRLAAEYEQFDPGYAEALKEQERLYGISKKPKRHGAVPERFKEFLELLDNGTKHAEACRIMNYPVIPPIDVKRYKLKFEGGRKGMWKAHAFYRSEEGRKAVAEAFGPQDC